MIPEKVTRIEQRIFLRGYQKFDILPNGELEVTIKRIGTHNQFKFPLWHLDPNFSRLKMRQGGTTVGLVIFGFLSAALVICMIMTRDTGTAAALSFPLFLFLFLFCACVWHWQIKSINAAVFRYRGSGAGQIYIWHEKPNLETFRNFCETLSKKAEEAWNNRPIEPKPNSLAGELTALKKLKDDGVLNENEFERAKAKLLEQAEQKRIGFA